MSDQPDDWPELRESFITVMRIARRSDRTIETYLEGTDKFARFLDDRTPGQLVKDATTNDLRAFLASLADAGNKPNSVATRHRALRALFKFMHAEEIIADDPMRKIPTPPISDERVPPALTVEQVDAMARACPRSTFIGARDRALILLISSSGLRSAEALSLTESDLHLDADQPRVVVKGKGGAYREAACSREAALAIRAYLRVRGRQPSAVRPELWLSRVGNPIGPSGLLQIVREAAQRAGIDEPVHVHALRHTATHQMLERGMGEWNVATQLGHKSLKQLARYGKQKTAQRSRDDFFRTQDR